MNRHIYDTCSFLHRIFAWLGSFQNFVIKSFFEIWSSGNCISWSGPNEIVERCTSSITHNPTWDFLSFYFVRHGLKLLGYMYMCVSKTFQVPSNARIEWNSETWVGLHGQFVKNLCWWIYVRLVKVYRFSGTDGRSQIACFSISSLKQKMNWQMRIKLQSKYIRNKKVENKMKLW